jgi:hypothetical protein
VTQPRTQDLSLGKTLAAAGHVPHQKFSARGGVGKVSNYINMLPNLVPRACDPWEGNECSGIIRIRHTENCMSTELRMRWQKQNKLFEIFYCFVYKMMIFSGFWWKC